ncbi:hypothetical protein HWV62_11447 [Athelia sp. TMB]|nr:hypothetical protein HWV62_11447 [Athelia sp. TMB]
MGRPLYSAAYSTPAVRTAPESVPSAVPAERWSRWGSFDPDSDEFFESDDAVYEAFIDPADLVQTSQPRPASESIGVFVEREMERAYSPVESLSSDSTVSGRASPMAEGPDDPAAMVADAYYSTQPSARRPVPPHRSNSNWTSGTTVDQPPRSWSPPPVTDSSDPRAAHFNEQRRVRNRVAVSPRTFIPPRASIENDTTPPPPAREVLTPVDNPSPSPAPAVTPHPYSWNAYSAARSIPESPTPAPRYHDSPLTNPSARISIPHLSPAPLRIRTA